MKAPIAWNGQKQTGRSVPWNRQVALAGLSLLLTACSPAWKAEMGFLYREDKPARPVFLAAPSEMSDGEVAVRMQIALAGEGWAKQLLNPQRLDTGKKVLDRCWFGIYKYFAEGGKRPCHVSYVSIEKQDGVWALRVHQRYGGHGESTAMSVGGIAGGFAQVFVPKAGGPNIFSPMVGYSMGEFADPPDMVWIDILDDKDEAVRLKGLIEAVLADPKAEPSYEYASWIPMQQWPRAWREAWNKQMGEFAARGRPLDSAASSSSSSASPAQTPTNSQTPAKLAKSSKASERASRTKPVSSPSTPTSLTAP